jgi:toxin ParE1/3/4
VGVVRYRPRATADLEEIADFLAALEAPGRAERILAHLINRARWLASQPGIGRRRDDLGPGIRTWPERSFIIVYRVVAADTEVVRVAEAIEVQGHVIRAVTLDLSLPWIEIEVGLLQIVETAADI